VKKSGCFGRKSRETIRRNFRRLKRCGIKCAYVTFEEGRTYKWRATKLSLPKTPSARELMRSRVE